MRPLIVAQLTDTHLFAAEEPDMMGIQTGYSLRLVLERLQTLEHQPDLLLLTGDLSQDESLASYTKLRGWITPLGIPTRWIPGNHDILPIMEQGLQGPMITSDRCFQMGNWNFVLLSSLKPRSVYGELSRASLEWLEQQLRHGCQYPTLLAIHHPPILIGSQWMDDIRLLNPTDLYQVIDPHPQVKLVLFGHIHQEFDGQRHGVRYLGTPSTCVQFKPRCPTMIIDAPHPGFRLLRLYPDGRYETEVIRVAYTAPICH